MVITQYTNPNILNDWHMIIMFHFTYDYHMIIIYVSKPKLPYDNCKNYAPYDYHMWHIWLSINSNLFLCDSSCLLRNKHFFFQIIVILFVPCLIGGLTPHKNVDWSLRGCITLKMYLEQTFGTFVGNLKSTQV